METRKLVVSGLVQGVGFRWSTQMLANKMGIPGTVRNNSDGTVTIYIQGEPSELDHFIEKLPSADFAFVAAYARPPGPQKSSPSLNSI